MTRWSKEYRRTIYILVSTYLHTEAANTADYTDEEKCVECGAAIPGIKAPKEISGSLICKKCAEKQGLPTLMSQLGLRLRCEEKGEE